MEKITNGDMYGKNCGNCKSFRYGEKGGIGFCKLHNCDSACLMVCAKHEEYNNKEIVADIMSRNEKHWITQINNGNDFTPLMPYMLMNVSNSIAEDFVPIKVKGNNLANQLRGRWIAEWEKYKRDIGTSLDSKEKKKWVDDKADKMAEYLNNDIVISKISLMDCFKSEPLEVQEIVASALLSKALAVCAQTLHGLVYKVKPTYTKMSVGKTPYYQESYSDEISIPIRNTIKWIEKWVDAYYKGKNVDLNTKDKVQTSINVLIKKIVEFLKLQNEN